MYGIWPRQLFFVVAVVYSGSWDFYMANVMKFYTQVPRPMAISMPILVLPSGELLRLLRSKVSIETNMGQWS